MLLAQFLMVFLKMWFLLSAQHKNFRKSHIKKPTWLERLIKLSNIYNAFGKIISIEISSKRCYEFILHNKQKWFFIYSKHHIFLYSVRSSSSSCFTSTHNERILVTQFDEVKWTWLREGWCLQLFKDLW